MIEDGIFYDGYLEFAEPPEAEAVKIWSKGYGDSERKTWSKRNVSMSLQLTQAIIKIQLAYREHNQSLGDTDCDEKKLVLNLPQLVLYKEHRQFINFWFDVKEKDLAHF